MSEHDAHGEHDHEHHGTGHYVRIYFILLVLFIISVLGPAVKESGVIPMSESVGKAVILITAFGIALVKAYYVVAYFMHLKFEQKIVNYMLVTCVVFMFLFFSAVAPDVMRHKGENWTNTAAASEVARALKVIEEGPQDPEPVETNIQDDPKSIAEYAKLAEMKYQMPIEAAMAVTVHEGARPVFLISDKKPGATPEEFKAAEKKAKELEAAPRDAFVVDQAKADAGKALYVSKTCSACHSIDGSKLVGPSFKGLSSRATVTEKAEVFMNDAAYFIESIKQPQAKIVRGYGAALMPSLPVTDDEMDKLLHYVGSL